MSEAIVGIVLTVFLTFIGLGWGALAMPSHPDRVAAAKLFFSLAGLTFALTLIQWTLSTDSQLLIRLTLDFVGVTLATVGLLAGLQFADRSELADLSAELSIPSSALILERRSVWNKKTLALIIIGALTFSALINVLRSVAGWSWPNSEAIWNLPWRWVLPSIVIGVIGALLFLMVGRRRLKHSRLLAEKYKWLTDLAAKQKDEIDEWVKVKGCDRGDLNIHVPLGDPQSVRLSIWVTNKSVLDISLSDKLAGAVKFQNMELSEAKPVINSVKDIPSGETACLTFEQRLSPSEVKAILDAQYSVRPQYYNFDKLVVMIEGGKRSPDISPKELNMGANFANAFPVNLQERGQRIRVLAEVRGSVVQLYEPLRISSNNPLPKSDIEHWVSESLKTLERGYDEEAVKRLWREITHDEAIPEEAISQGAWLRGCITVLGSQLEYETGEYIRQPPTH